jgi:hypothetical protein
MGSYLRISVHCVRHPTTGLDLIGIQAPELEFFFEERAADVRRIVKLAGPVIIEDLSKHARMTIEEIFV